MSRCPDCGWEYEPGMLSPYVSAADDRSATICAICALKRRNEYHGTSFTSFRGGTAQAMLEAAEAWRAEHPGCAP